MKKAKILFLTFLSGVTTGIGALFGAFLGRTSNTIIGTCLAFAAGAMLYIVSAEMIPEANTGPIPLIEVRQSYSLL